MTMIDTTMIEKLKGWLSLFFVYVIFLIIDNRGQIYS